VSGTARVEAWRGDTVEALHRVSVAVVDGGGRLVAAAGDPGTVAYARSAIKPFQALPIVEDGVAERFGFTPEQLALCCASHSGEPFHVGTVAAMLAAVGCNGSDLACGPHLPLGAEAARALLAAGGEPDRLHNNCSGKHAGMLGLARLHGWPLAGYERPEHPVQQRMLREVVRWCDVAAESVPTGVDGCGIVTFALPLDRLAAGFARFARAAGDGVGGAAVIADAMTRYPDHVAGTGRMCTALMRVARGRIIAKVGAEGVYCAGVPSMGLGVALKVEDGAVRAAEPALLAVLHALGALSDDEMGALDAYARPPVMNSLGDRVGMLRTLMELERHAE
jgi:L-asparaginase II